MPLPEDKTAILISIGALVVSAFAVGWNFYRDVILKARVKVAIKISNIHHGDTIHGPFISISVINFGPGSITCESIHMMKRSCLSFLCVAILKIPRLQNKYADIINDYTNPYSSNLPKKLQVGERLTLLLRKDENCLLAVNPTHVGVVDSFGRFHWATRSSLKKAKKDYFKEYQIKPWVS